MDSYRDLLLSDNILFILRGLRDRSTDDSDRGLYAKMSEKAAILTAELGALVKTESVRHLQTVHDICEVALVYQQDELRFLERMVGAVSVLKQY